MCHFLKSHSFQPINQAFQFQTRLHGNTATELILINRGDSRTTNSTSATANPLSNTESSLTDASAIPSTAQQDSFNSSTHQIRPLNVHVTTEQNTVSRNGVGSQASHRSIIFSHPTDSPSKLTTECATSCSTNSQTNFVPPTNITMNTDSEQQRRVAELVADQVVSSLMTELFDESQLEEETNQQLHDD